MRRSTLDELADRYGIEHPVDTRGQRFNNFMGFNATYWAACHCIRTPDDLARLITEVTEDAAEHGAWWHEPAFDAARYSTERAGSPHQMFETPQDCWRFGLEAAEAAERATGVGIAFVAAADRTQPVERAVERAEVVKQLVSSRRHMIKSGMECFDGHHSGIASFGLHANEEGCPPEPFAEAFRVATTGTGLLSTPHAGEIAPFPEGGPASVEGAIDVLGADRIQHGVLSIEDPELVGRLAAERVCLDVCPSSNLLLNVFGFGAGASASGAARSGCAVLAGERRPSAVRSEPARRVRAVPPRNGVERRAARRHRAVVLRVQRRAPAGQGRGDRRGRRVAQLPGMLSSGG